MNTTVHLNDKTTWLISAAAVRTKIFFANPPKIKTVIAKSLCLHAKLDECEQDW